MFLSQNIKVQLLTFYLMIGPNLNEKIHDRYMTLLSLQTHSSPHLRTTRSIIVGSLYSVMEKIPCNTTRFLLHIWFRVTRTLI